MNLNEALEILHEIDFASEVFEGILSDEDVKAIETVIDTVEDIQPVVHAHWKEISRVRHIGKCNLPISRCSCCNFEFCDIINTNELYNFCPYCGAKMDEKEERYVRDIFCDEVN